MKKLAVSLLSFGIILGAAVSAEAADKDEMPVYEQVESKTLENSHGKVVNQEDSCLSRKKGTCLRKGDCIGVVAPASTAGENIDELWKTVKFLKGLGYKVKISKAAKTADADFYGGHYKRCAEEFKKMFSDDNIKAIVCLRGGYGSMCMLDELKEEDFDIISRHPKLFIGYSDITAVHNVLGERCGLVTIHGPMMLSVLKGSYLTLDEFEKGIRGTTARVPEMEKKNIAAVYTGAAEGRLVGGNLSMLAATCGTPYELNGDGGILFIEEIGEDGYRIDRMLRQLYENGLLSRVRGIAYGSFTDCSSEPGEPKIEEILAYYAKLAGKPAIRGIPAGHGDKNMFLPLGVRVKIHADESGEGVLEFLEDYAKK